MYKGTALNPDTSDIDKLPANFGATARSSVLTIIFLLAGLTAIQGGYLPF